MNILQNHKSTALCFLAAASLPCALGQDTEADAGTSTPENAETKVQGEAHQNLSQIDQFIQSRLDDIALNDEDRLYDPLGVIKDGAMTPPEREVVVNNGGDDTQTPEPVNPLKETVDALVITGFNAGGGKILLGVNEIGIGQAIPGSEDIILAGVQPNKLTFKSKSSGETYERPVGFKPGGVSSRSDFLDSIEGVNRR